VNDPLVAYLGPELTYSHLAASGYQPRPERLRACETIDQVFAAIERGQVDCGLVPLYNSNSGLVLDTARSILRRLSAADDPPGRARGPAGRAETEAEKPLAQLCISDVQPFAVQHCLVSWGRLETIETVASKAQALQQCGQWLDRNLPRAARQATRSSSAALERLSEQPTRAAIVSRAAAAALAAPLVICDIQTDPQNATEFVVVQLDAVEKRPRRDGQDLPSAVTLCEYWVARWRGSALGRIGETGILEWPDPGAGAAGEQDGASGSWQGQHGRVLWQAQLHFGAREYWVGKLAAGRRASPQAAWTATTTGTVADLVGSDKYFERAWRLGAAEVVAAAVDPESGT